MSDIFNHSADAFDSMLSGEGMCTKPEPYSTECKYCGRKEYEWHMTENGWRLLDRDGNIHRCNKWRKNFVKIRFNREES